MHAEFIQYKLLKDDEIDEKIWNQTTVTVDEKNNIKFVRVDVIWSFLFQKRQNDGNLCFNYLKRIIEAILVLPHSNAAEERVFSIIKKNKTPFRGSLNLDGTLSSIVTVKLAADDELTITKDFLKSAKKAASLDKKP